MLHWRDTEISQKLIACGNIAQAERPYNDMSTAIDAQRKVQSFEQALTERFSAIQTQRDDNDQSA